MYLLTDQSPAMLPYPDGFNGMTLQHAAPASDLLLSDLRSDRGMEWVPDKAWLTKIAIDADGAAARLRPRGRRVRRQCAVPRRGRARYARRQSIRP